MLVRLVGGRSSWTRRKTNVAYFCCCTACGAAATAGQQVRGWLRQTYRVMETDFTNGRSQKTYENRLENL
jgi:hypothetical protein